MDVIQVYEHELAITQGNLARAYFAIERVRELHHPFTHNGFDGLQEYCNHCSYSQLQEYPCPTIKALDGETEYPKGPIQRPEEEGKQ